MAWSNVITVYHGTTETAANEILSDGRPDLSLGRGAADFGKGFYVTTSLHQAQQWANQKVRSNPRGAHLVAAVVTFDFNWDWSAGDAVHVLGFVVADTPFHDFVVLNRLGSTSHNRHAGKPYDLVYGPVAAYPQTLTYANCDQICFVAGGVSEHSVVTALGPPRQTLGLGNPLF